MAELAAKVKNALDEGRMLALGLQVLLGFDYRAFFEPEFPKLPRAAQASVMANLCVLLATFALVLLPTARHRLCERGKASDRFQAFTGAVMGIALLPFALAIGLALFLAGIRASGLALGAALGAAAALLAASAWYGVALSPQRRRRREVAEEEEVQTDLQHRIEQVLTEARVVLPGAQALLGFQLAIMLMEAFPRLPASSAAVHVASLALVGGTTVCLMAPAAYHRLVERGEDSERLERFSGRMVIAAMALLAPGLAGDLFVVVRKWTGSAGWGAAAAALCLAFFYATWFGLTLLLRRRRRPRRAAHA